jgi:environmental stress-induced protein Ves
MLRHIPQSELLEGLWRNGQGVSWEIASYKKEGATDFSWRFAKARIDNDVPFSIYPGMDRIFMMIEGQGMDLQFEGGRVLQVHEKFVPHEFSCDVPLFCKLLGGPSLDLNLFAARREFRAECEVISLARSKDLNVAKTDVVFFVLDGACELNGVHLLQGDAAIVQNESIVVCKAENAKLYVGKLHQLEN